MNPFLSMKSRLFTFALCISLIPIAVTTTVYYLHAKNALQHRILEDLNAIAIAESKVLLSDLRLQIWK